jgi:hypothetical protein
MTAPDYPPAVQSDQSVGELLGRVSTDLSQLFRQELALAKSEMRIEAKKAGRAAGMLSGAGVAATMTVLFASVALLYALGSAMPLGWAALIVAVMWAVAGAGLYSVGRQRLREVSPVPVRTVESLKEDAQWMKNPTG